ncbi:MAG: nucleotidyltransferase [Bacteroidales bacterium]|nr:nucleotidyltransferase [Bacteroidales bacterium]
MIQFDSNKTQIENLLARMAESIQLDDTRKERMKSAYEAIENLLKEDTTFFKKIDFEVYPQGSVRIGTTVKPIAKNEFDLDIVIHLILDWHKYTPEQIYNELKRVLINNGSYREKIELKNRCIRLNYAGDFHMDIIPGCQENSFDQDKLLVADRELGNWTSSNPRGYSSWFMQKVNIIQLTLLEKAYTMEKLPIDEFAKKKPLQRAVQLIKMYRDKFFENNQEMATTSIILTTIFGEYYNGEESIFNTIENIISKIKNDIPNKEMSFSRIVVLNPVNNEEDFTDKWTDKPNLYKEFKNFIVHLDYQWKKLKADNGIDEDNSNILKGLFGESIFNKAKMINEDFVTKDRSSTSDPFIGLKKLAAPVTPAHKMWLC